MADTKRVPTELEVKVLLRDVERRMEDERAVGDWCELARRRRPLGPRAMVVIALLTFGACAALTFMEKQGQPRWLQVALIALAMMVVAQSIAIRRLMRVTTALARMSERARDAEPLPRAPSPPAASAS